VGSAKGRPESEAGGPTAAESWRALLAHVAVYHLVMAVMLAVTVALLDLPIGWAEADLVAIHHAPMNIRDC
jgi:hypothetical protein